jgi:hypothetical protein
MTRVTPNWAATTWTDTKTLAGAPPPCAAPGTRRPRPDPAKQDLARNANHGRELGTEEMC